MSKTREIIQMEALEAAKVHNYTGTLAVDPGSGKSKVAIDCIKQGNFKNILITSPRTNLKKSWEDELEKWNIIKLDHNEQLNAYSISIGDNKYSQTSIIFITLENIQTCYKWSIEQLRQFDFIIIDEIHCISKEYFNLIHNAELCNAPQKGIPTLGLTGTPNKSDPFKKEILYTTLPIIYEYFDAEEDGITNSIKYWIYEYELSDNFKVVTGTKDKKWLIGEAKQYAYLSDQYEKGKTMMTELEGSDYFNTSLLWMKGKELIVDPTYKPDPENSFNISNIPMIEVPCSKEKKLAGTKFFFAVRKRKEFLWNLESSKQIALAFKKEILSGYNIKRLEPIANTYIPGYEPNIQLIIKNKVLLFSELTQQAENLSPYALHSNNSKNAKECEEINKRLLDSFNAGTIRELSSCLSLTLGLNMNGANWAIFESYSSSRTNFIQKCKRLVRLDKNEVANVILIVAKGTQTETWKNELVKDLNYTVITKINELII
jgi:superfamily II DNA or RNA helicase